jgi:hypothetical protein
MMDDMSRSSAQGGGIVLDCCFASLCVLMFGNYAAMSSMWANTCVYWAAAYQPHLHCSAFSVFFLTFSE